MPAQIFKTQLKAKALGYFRQVEASGEPLVVTDPGQPELEIHRCPSAAVADALERLRGSVIHYDDPLEPVGLEDWDALK